MQIVQIFKNVSVTLGSTGSAVLGALAHKKIKGKRSDESVALDQLIPDFLRYQVWGHEETVEVSALALATLQKPMTEHQIRKELKSLGYRLAGLSESVAYLHLLRKHSRSGKVLQLGTYYVDPDTGYEYKLILHELGGLEFIRYCGPDTVISPEYTLVVADLPPLTRPK